MRVLASKRLGVTLSQTEAARLLAAHSRVSSALGAIAQPPAVLVAPPPPKIDPGRPQTRLAQRVPMPPIVHRAGWPPQELSPTVRGAVQRGISPLRRVIASSLASMTALVAIRAVLVIESWEVDVVAAVVLVIALLRAAWSAIAARQPHRRPAWSRIFTFLWVALTLLAWAKVAATITAPSYGLVAGLVSDAVVLCWLAEESLRGLGSSDVVEATGQRSPAQTAPEDPRHA